MIVRALPNLLIALNLRRDIVDLRGPNFHHWRAVIDLLVAVLNNQLGRERKSTATVVAIDMQHDIYANLPQQVFINPVWHNTYK